MWIYSILVLRANILVWQLLHQSQREDGGDIFISSQGQAFVCKCLQVSVLKII